MGFKHEPDEPPNNAQTDTSGPQLGGDDELGPQLGGREECAVAEEKKDPKTIHHRKPKNTAAQITMPVQKKFSKLLKKIRDKAAKDRKQSAEDKQDRGQLGPLATAILMRILYAAREARFDLLRAVNKTSC